MSVDYLITKPYTPVTPDSTSSSKGRTEHQARLGARTVSMLLLTAKGPVHLTSLGKLLADSNPEFFPILERSIDTAINKNWVKRVTTPESESIDTFQPSDCLKVIEACISGNLPELQELESSGAVSQNLNDWVESMRDEHQGRKLCPLIAGIESGCKDTVKYLENQGAEVRAFPENKKSQNNLLHYLVHTPFTEGFEEIARKIISENQELLLRTNKKKKTPLEVAQAVNNKLMASLFKEHLEDKTKPISPDSDYKPTDASHLCQDESSKSRLPSCSSLEAECIESLDTLLLSSLVTTDGCPIAEQEQFEDSFETSSENSFNYQDQPVQPEPSPTPSQDTSEDKKITPITSTNPPTRFSRSPALVLPITQTDRSEQILALDTPIQITHWKAEQPDRRVTSLSIARKIVVAILRSGTPLTPEKTRDAMSQHCGRKLKSVPLIEIEEGIKTALDKGWITHTSTNDRCYELSLEQQVIEEAWEGLTKTLQAQNIPCEQLNYWLESRRPEDGGAEISPLLAAVQSNNSETIKVMLTYLAPDTRDSKGNNVLHKLSQSGTNYLPGIVYLLSTDFDAIKLLYTVNNAGERPVDIAQREKKSDVLYRLYKNKMEHLEKDEWNKTHIETTINENKVSPHLETDVVVVQKLDHQPNVLDSSCLEVITIDTDSSSETESIFPIEQENKKTGTPHWTELLHAGDLNEFQKQIETTPALWNADYDGNTPAHLIAVTGFGQSIRVKRLQKKLGSDDSMPRHKSNQLLNTFFSFAKKLGLPLFQKNSSGDTPLHLAIENAQTEVAMALILYASKEDLAETNSAQKTAFHLALAYEARPIAFSILYRNSSEDILLEEQAKWMDTIMHTPEAILNRRQQLSSDTKEQTDKPETQLTSAFHQSLPPKLPGTHLKTE